MSPFLILILLVILLAVIAMIWPNPYLCPVAIIVLCAAILIRGG
jgi:hypothetical protein